MKTFLSPFYPERHPREKRQALVVFLGGSEARLHVVTLSDWVTSRHSHFWPPLDIVLTFTAYFARSLILHTPTVTSWIRHSSAIPMFTLGRGRILSGRQPLPPQKISFIHVNRTHFMHTLSRHAITEPLVNNQKSGLINHLNCFYSIGFGPVREWEWDTGVLFLSFEAEIR